MDLQPPAQQQYVQQQQQQQPPPAAESAQPRELKVEDALQYLDQVKAQFGDQPKIYTQFLDIMKNFKAATIDTPGVINRVSKLFKNHDNLILGFNTFLPPGFKIKPENLLSYQQPQETYTQDVNQQMAVPNQGQMISSQPVVDPSVPDQQPVEFDHAVSYVTKIKQTFSDDPQTYKKFLEILHTYQKDETSIEEVMREISQLFHNHPDLLDQFTYFLPDKSAPENEGVAAGMMKPSEHLQRLQALGRKPFSQSSTTGAIERQALSRREEAARARGQGRGAKDSRSKKRSQENSNSFRGGGGGGGGGGAGSVTNERRFFEKVKEVLPRQGGRDLWSELLKCLDLYSQEVLERSEMISLVADLFGKHTDLFGEFKSMINERGIEENAGDKMWFSMPLSEIDFSQCRRCTPSYRALPRDYPRAPSSERSETDDSVLNDTWVSVPTGSEDFSNKSMRKNQFEEALFKCEDDRYEIDMVIDSTNSTIRVLEPLVEEIKGLEEKNGQDDAGVTQFQYRLDKRTLGTVHLNVISRIYSDHGTEILELLRKNPAGAIPVVLARLTQKSKEWIKVRADLQKGWKDLLERNYLKSLDHRSFYFKQHDKRLLNSRSLIAEIKAAAAAAAEAAAEGGGDSGGGDSGAGATAAAATPAATPAAAAAAGGGAAAADAATPAVVPAAAAAAAGATAADASAPPAATADPAAAAATATAEAAAAATSATTTPAAAAVKGDADRNRNRNNSKDAWKPHLSLTFLNPQIHYDVQSLIAHALEHHTAEAGIERAVKWWRSFLHPEFFALPKSWLEPVGPTYELPPGTVVETVFGTGTLKLVRADDTCLVSLPFGEAYLRPEAVTPQTVVPPMGEGEGVPGTVVKSKTDVKTDAAAPAAAVAVGAGAGAGAGANGVPAAAGGGAGDGMEVDSSAKGAGGGDGDDDDGDDVQGHNFICNTPGYLFFRLYHFLYERLLRARQLCAMKGAEDQVCEGAVSKVSGRSGLYRRYEDSCRSLIGSQSYQMFTLDKLTQQILHQLNSVVSNETSVELQRLHDAQSASNLSSSNATLDASYMNGCAGVLSEEEDAFRVHYHPGVRVHKQQVQVQGSGIGLVKEGPEASEADDEEASVWKVQPCLSFEFLGPLHTQMQTQAAAAAANGAGDGKAGDVTMTDAKPDGVKVEADSERATKRQKQ